MASTPYILPRETRESAILVGNGTAGPYAASLYKIFDTADVEVFAKALGETVFTDVTASCTIAKVNPAAAYDYFTVTFGAAVPATTSWYHQARRTAERSLAVTRAGTINSDQLEKELSKQASAQSELRRDVNRAAHFAPDFVGSSALPPAEGDKIIGWKVDGSGLENKTPAAIGLVVISDDGMLLDDSHSEVPTEHAVKTYADTKLAKASNLTDLADKATARNNLGVTVLCADIAALQAVDVSKEARSAEIWNAGGRNGTFDWLSGDQSANVTADPQKGVYVAPASAPTGASGAWVRRAGFLVSSVLAAWFGMAPAASAAANVTALQAACNFSVNSVKLPGGTCTLNDTITPKAKQTILGDYSSELSGGPTIVTVPVGFNKTLFNLTAGQTLHRLNITGTATATETLQVLVAVVNNNWCSLDTCLVTGGYDNVKLTGTSFYINLEKVTFYGGVHSQLYINGTDPGVDLIMHRCRFLGCPGLYNIYLNNLGSLIASDTQISVNTVTQCSILFDQPAASFGGMQWTNSVVESGPNSVCAVRYIGSSGTPWTTAIWTNSMVGGNGDAFRVEHLNTFEFDGGLMTFVGAGTHAVNVVGGVSATLINFRICSRFESDVASNVAILAGAGSTVSGTIEAPLWNGTGAFIDFSAATTVGRLDCTPGSYGSNATPVILPAGNIPGVRMHLGKGQLNGTGTNDNAVAGNVGEYIESVVASASQVVLATVTSANMTSIVLTAGDWDVDAMFSFTGGPTTTITYLIGSISLVSATVDATKGRSDASVHGGATLFASSAVNKQVNRRRITVAAGATQTVYAVAQASFGVSNCGVYGTLSARRAR